MNAWMRESATARRFLAEENAVLEATEMVAECLDERDITRNELAGRVGVSRSEITQRLNGKRNLTVKTLAAMLHEMGYRLCLGTRDLTDARGQLRPFHAAPPSSWTRHQEPVHYTPTGTALRVVPVGSAA